MNDLDAYRTYLAFKLHFTTDKYDITKTKGAVSASRESFLKRTDQLPPSKKAYGAVFALSSATRSPVKRLGRSGGT